MNFVRSYIYSFRYFIILLLLLSCYYLWPGVEKALKVDNSLNIWFLEDDPALVEYNRYTERFGNDETIFLLIKDPVTVLTSEYFRSFIKLTNSLEAIPEVEGVLGPGNIQVPTNNLLVPGGRNLIRENSDVEQVKLDLEEYPYIRDEFFTANKEAVRFVIIFKPLPDFDDHRDRLIKKVRNTVAAEFPAGNTFLGGVGIIFSGLNNLSQEDFAFFLGVGYLLMFLLILFIYRSFYVLAYTFLTIAFSTFLCIGIYGVLGHQLNLMTTLIPTVLILLGILDIVHILNEHKVAENDEEAIDVFTTLKKVFRPCLYTTLTTMAGFLSLLSSPMAILKNFGIFTAIGIFLCLLFSFFLALIFLPLISRKETALFPKVWFLSLHKHVQEKKLLYAGLSFILIFACALGIFKLNNDTYTLGYFPKEHQVVQDHLEIEKTWGAYMPFELMITPNSGYSLYSPEVVRAGLEFSDSAKNIPGIGSSFGFPDLYYAGLQNRYRENAGRMLQHKSGLAQVDFLQTGYPQLSHYYIDRKSGTGRITVFGEMSSAVELTAKKDALLKTGKAAFGEVAGITPAGYLPMYSQIVHYAAQSQVYSLILAFALVFLLVWLFIKSFKLALLAIIPNLFPVLLILGVMGWLGIDLDIATASISAIVLSFCIDDTLHFIYHYKKHRNLGKDPLQSRILTLTRVGTAIVLTSLILLAGYLLMLFASLKTVYLFGLLTAIAIIGALFSHLILLPILLERFDRRMCVTIAYCLLITND